MRPKNKKKIIPFFIVICIFMIIGIVWISLKSRNFEQIEAIYEDVTEYSRTIKLQRNGKTYSDFANASSLEKGKQIGVVKDDTDLWIYEVEGYDSNEWLILYLYGEQSLYKADNLTNIPQEFEELRNQSYTNSEKQFKGTIIEVYSNESFIVEPDENEEIRKSSDKISIQSNTDEILEIGMKVIVTYTGEVMESYPAQIRTISVQIYKE